MEITWFGQSTFRIKTKTAVAITDPFDAEYTGLKKLRLSGDIVTISHDHQDHNAVGVVDGDPKVFWGAGEFEVKQMRIHGVTSFHDKKEGEERGRNTIFVFTAEGINVCHLGDLGHELSTEQLEAIGGVDILLVPVGGTYTIGPAEAVEIAAKLEPKILIPMHYKIPGLKFDLLPVENFFKAYGKNVPDAESKLVITVDKLPDTTQLVLLNTA